VSEVKAFDRLWSALGHVAQRDDRVDLAARDVVQRCPQADRVAVRIRDECDARQRR
jgi:hypothetical protein